MRVEAPIPAEVFDAIRAPFLAMPAETLDAPVVQPLSQLLDLAGETLRERLFIVQTGEGGAEACLRTDFTLPALSAHIASGRSSGRYFYSGRAFRVAPAGSTRAEEFPQVGVEAFEPGAAELADAEMAAVAWRAAAAGGRDDLTLLLGDVALFSALIDTVGLAPPLAARLKRAFSSPRKLQAELEAADRAEVPGPRQGERLAALLSGLPEAEAAGVLEEIWSLAGIEPVGGRSAVEIVHRLGERARLADAPSLTAEQAQLVARFLAISGEPLAAIDAIGRLAPVLNGGLARAQQMWATRIEAILCAGVPAERLRFSAAFGRAFGYYDGMVFEIRSETLGRDQPVAAGGRYDNLAARLGGRLETGAVGCMVRPGRAWVGGKA